MLHNQETRFLAETGFLIIDWIDSESGQRQILNEVSAFFWNSW